jgi:3-hydroxybutyryl-CoA dehydrogenase
MVAGVITRVSVIGAGLMGHGIAQVFASAGLEVMLMDVEGDRLDSALLDIRENLGLMSENGLAAGADAGEIVQRIATTTELEEAAQADFVVEAVPEKLELKQDLFEQLDSLAPPEAILATNTSVISITEIAARASNKGRILGTHFWNPPYLVPLVEVIPGAESSQAAVDAAFELIASAGKHPVRVKKDVPGFVGNRLQHALWREAVSIVERGIADAETVDEVVKMGFGMRLPVLGPLESADMIGLDLTLQIHGYILQYIEDSHEPSPLLREIVESGALGFKTGRGFETWTPERIAKARDDLQLHLMSRIRAKEGKARDE